MAFSLIFLEHDLLVSDVALLDEELGSWVLAIQLQPS